MYNLNVRDDIITTTILLPSRQAGGRVGSYLDVVVPLIMHFMYPEGDDELKESCLQAFEALVLRCCREITPHIKAVRPLIKYQNKIHKSCI